MEYIDTYQALNPHLHSTPAKKSTIDNIYRITREPPTILRYAEETQQAAMNIYKFSPAIFEQHTVYFTQHAVRCVKRDVSGDTIINAFTLWGNGYYHFLTEVLPCVLEINRQHTIHTMGSRFAAAVLAWFGFGNVSFERPGPNVSISWEQPYVECGNPSPQKIDLIRAVVTQKTQFTRTRGILVFRREAVRRILNSDAVLEMLQRCFPHLEWVVFDSLPFHETVALFSTAAIIVAPHGAGLTNMLFSATGTRIIEFMPIQHPNLCYWHLSEMLGNTYSMIPCPTVDGNFTIDVAAVETLIVPASQYKDILD